MIDFNFNPGTFVKVIIKGRKTPIYSIFKEVKGENIYTYIDFINGNVYCYDQNLLTFKNHINDIQEVSKLEKDEFLTILQNKGYYWNPINLKVGRSKFPDGTIVTDNFFAYVYGGSKYEYTLAVNLKTLEVHNTEDLGYVNSDVFEKTSKEVAETIHNIINNVYSKEELPLIKRLLDQKLTTDNNEGIIHDIENNLFIDEDPINIKLEPVDYRVIDIHHEFENLVRRMKRDILDPFTPIKTHDIETSSLVLVRNSDKEVWVKKFFLRRDDSGINVTTDGGYYKFCIKFIGNEKLLNTI